MIKIKRQNKQNHKTESYIYHPLGKIKIFKSSGPCKLLKNNWEGERLRSKTADYVIPDRDKHASRQTQPPQTE